MTLPGIAGRSFGRKFRTVVALVGLVVAVGGVGVAAGVLGTPSVVGVDNRFAGVDDRTTTVESDLHVSNPNPVGVQLGGTTVEYAVSMNSIRMAEGTKRGVGVESGNSTVNLTTRIHNERIPAWWTSHVSNGERTTVSVDASARSSLVGTTVDAPAVEREVSTDVGSAFDSTETRPIDAGQPLVADPVLYLNETSGTWGTVNESATPVEMSFVVYNPKPYPITASAIGYDVTMNDVAVGSGSSERAVVIPPGETRTVDATTVIRNQRLDEWWVSHLRRNQVTDLEIRFSARFDLSGAGGPTVRVPLDSVTHTIETDVFGNKSETGPPTYTDANGTGDGSADGGETDDGAGEGRATDADGGDGATETATPTETSTDDGVLPVGNDPVTPTETDGGLL